MVIIGNGRKERIFMDVEVIVMVNRLSIIGNVKVKIKEIDRVISIKQPTLDVLKVDFL